MFHQCFVADMQKLQWDCVICTICIILMKAWCQQNCSSIICLWGNLLNDYDLMNCLMLWCCLCSMCVVLWSIIGVWFYHNFFLHSIRFASSNYDFLQNKNKKQPANKILATLAFLLICMCVAYKMYAPLRSANKCPMKLNIAYKIVNLSRM